MGWSWLDCPIRTPRYRRRTPVVRRTVQVMLREKRAKEYASSLHTSNSSRSILGSASPNSRQYSSGRSEATLDRMVAPGDPWIRVAAAGHCCIVAVDVGSGTGADATGCPV